MFRHYKWNFVIVVFLVSLIGFIIFDIIISYNIRNYLFRQIFNEMRAKTNLAVKLVEEKNFSPLTTSPDTLYNLALQIKTMVDSRVTIIAPDGRVISDSDVEKDHLQFLANHANRPEVLEAASSGWGQDYRLSDTVKRKLFYTAFTIQHDGKAFGFLRLAYYASNFESSLNSILYLIFIANVIGLIILFISAYYLGSLVSFPILRIVKTAQKISAGNFDKTFLVNRKDEIGILSQILNELTDRLKNQIELLSYEGTKLENIFTSLNIGIIAIDKTKTILHANPVIFQILKLEPQAVIHQQLEKILDWLPILAAIDITLQHNLQQDGEHSFKRGASKIFISYLVSPFSISKEENGALIQIQDVSEIKYLEAIRRNFVASASHELKTPLTAIVGYAETLLDGPGLTPEAKLKFLRRILEQSRRLEYLVTDMLKLSQLEHDIPLEVKAVKLLPFLKKIIDDFQEKANQKNISLSLKSFDRTLSVEADEELLYTAMENLVDNALKYTPERGSVKINIKEADKKRIRIEVEDTGIGIEPKYHERIFQRFYRVDKARSRELGGTGLGLSIVKHIVERHGGTIYVKSNVGEGSCFCFDLKRT